MMTESQETKFDPRDALSPADTRKYLPLAAEWAKMDPDEQDAVYFYAHKRAAHPDMTDEEFLRQFDLEARLLCILAGVLLVVTGALAWVAVTL